MRRGLFLALSFLFILLQSLPFFMAQSAGDAQHLFAGFLLNPTDGFSYLAKMRQGFEGGWSFTLPYTTNPGDGSAINLYYLLLGHFARWAGWGLIFTFHAARITGGAVLCAALFRLFAILPEAQRIWAFGLALFGSGLGWVAVLFGGFTSDFWVAEAYPFLASFANPHFPLGLALQVFLVTPVNTPRLTVWGMGALALSIIYPFGWVLAVATLFGAATLVQAWQKGHSRQWKQAVCVLLAGLPYAIYSLWIVNAHPVLSGWTGQNITPAMPVWDLALSFSPPLLLAVMGARLVWKQRNLSLALFVAWLVACILLLYLPFGLQRRLMSGLYIPVAGLAVFFVVQLSSPSRRQLALLSLTLLALPTNFLLLLSGLQAAQTQDTALYIKADELAAYVWLDENVSRNELVLAPPRNSLHLPAFADVSVWFGHPFETVDADLRKAEQAAFFADPMGLQDFLSESRAQYILVDVNELPTFALPNWVTVFSQGSMEILTPNND